MSKQMALRKIIAAAAAFAALILMTSCPQQVTAPMVALVEDTIPPSVNISSPRGGDNYYSTVTVTGIINDDVLVESDEAGQITSIYYEIANDDYRKGKVNIGLDDSVTSDDTFGDGIINYDIQTGEFSFSISTLQSDVKSRLRDVISISVTAIDRNNNETVVQLTLRESSGPYVEFGFYSSGDYNELNRITALSGDRVYIGGYVANSDYLLDEANEIVSLQWTVAGTQLGATLDVTEDSPHWDQSSGVFRTTNAFEDTEFFRYNPDTRFFYTETFIDVEEGSKNFQVIAVDAYGHSTTIDQLLTPPASLMMSTPTATRTYYSTNPDISAARTIGFSSKITDPNDGLLTSDQIVSIQCSFTSTQTETAPATIDVFTSGIDDFDTFFNTATEPGRFEFNISTDDWPGTAGAAGDGGTLIDLTGDIYAKITVEDEKGKTKNKSVLIQRDDINPVISNISFTGGTSGYLKRDDTLTLTFTATDVTGSGVSAVESIDINIDAADADVSASVSKVGDNCSVNYSIPSDATSDADGYPVGYSIHLYDDAGNQAAASNTAAKTFYGPYSSNSYSLTSSAANTNTGNTGWARASGSPAFDTVTANFTSSRLLSGKPIVSLGGRTVAADNVTYDSSTGACTAQLVMDGNETTSDFSNILLNVITTDIVGNSENRSVPIAVLYDKNKPVQPTVPSWGGTYTPYINSTDMGGTTLTFNAGRSLTGARTGDSLELYLDNSSRTDIGSFDFVDSITQYSNITFAKTAIGLDGAKTIYSRVIDLAGNISDYSPVCGVTLDTVVDTVNAGSSYTGSQSKEAPFDQTGVETADSAGISLLEWTFAPNNVTATNINAEAVHIVDCPDNEYTATLTATDGAGNTRTSDFTFIWDTTAPEISGLPATRRDVNGNFTQDAIVSDDIGGITGSGIDGTTYQWDLDLNGDGPGAGDLYDVDNDSTLNITNAASLSGEYKAILTVDDNLGHTGTGSFLFYIDITKPTITDIPDIVPYQTVPFSRTASADDGTGSGVDTTTFQWTFSPDTVTATGTDTATVTISGCDTDSEPGSPYTASCTVMDNAGNTSNPETFTFYWDSTAPVVDAGISMGAINTSTTNTRTASVTDDPGSDINTSTYNWTVSTATGGTVTSSGTSTDTINITNCTVNGEYTVTCEVDDNAGNTGSDNFTFYWDTAGPTVDAGGSAGVVGAGFSRQATATEPAGAAGVNTSSFSWTFDPDTVTATGTSTDTFTVTGATTDQEYTATCTVSDALGNTSSDNFTFTLDTTPPNITQIADISVWVNGFTRTATVSDASTITYDWDIMDGASVEISNISDSASITVDADDLTDDKTYTARLTVTDAQTLSSEMTFDFQYDNDLPSADADADHSSNDYYTESHALTGTTTINASASDSVSGEASTVWTFVPNDVTATDFNALNIEITGASQGEHTGTLKVTDNAGNFRESTIIFDWDTANPVANAGADHISPYGKNGSFSQAGSATDTGTSIASYSWNVVCTSPAVTKTQSGATLNVNTGSTKITLATNGDEDGIYVATLTATDQAGHSDTDEFTFLWDTQDPTVVIDNATTPGSTNYTLTPTTASDNIGIYTYTWSYPVGLSVDDASAPALVINNYSIGTYTIGLTLTDGAGNTDYDTCTFTANGSKALSFNNSDPALLTGGSGGTSDSSSSRISTYNFHPTGNDSNDPFNSSLSQARPTSYSRTNTYNGNLYTPAASNSPEIAVVTGQNTVKTKDTRESEMDPIELTSEDIDTLVVMDNSAAKAASSALIKRTATVEALQSSDPEPERNRAAALLLLIPGTAGVILLLRKRKF